MWSKKGAQLLWFTAQLRLLYAAGMGFMISLSVLEESCPDKTLRLKIKGLMRNIEQGRSFSQALANYPEIFTEFYVEMITVGEETGKLSEILQELYKFYAHKVQFQKEFMQALTYPCVIMSLMLFLTFGLCFMVIPRFAAIFANFHAQLPWGTQILFVSVNFVRDHFIIVLILMAGAVGLGWKYLKEQIRKLKQQQRILRIPLLGSFYHAVLLLQLCRVLGIALKAGLSMQDAVKLLQKMFKPTPFALAITLIMYDLKQGRRLTEIFARGQYFPQIFQGFLRIAEETGTLDTQFLALAEIFEAKIEENLLRLKTLLEPCLMLIAGVIVGGVTLAIYYPIFSMGSLI